MQDLSFLSGSSDYDDVRKTLVYYLKTHPQCFGHLLQHTEEQDQNKLQAMLESLNESEHLSLAQMEEYHALLEESTNTPEGAHNTEPLKVALACKLLSDLSSPNEEIINTSDARRKLTRLKESEITEISDQPHQTATKEIRYPIDNLIDKLHYTSRLCSLLNRCYPSLHSTLTLTKDQCNKLAQCDIIYQNLRSQLLSLCSNPDDGIPKIWALSAIIRQLNRTWIKRYQDQIPPQEHAINPVPPEKECPISLLSFDEIAPTVEQANNIVLFDADNYLYSRDALMGWAISKSRFHIDRIKLPALQSPITRNNGTITNIIPLPSIINIEQFTIENILPVALPLGFATISH